MTERRPKLSAYVSLLLAVLILIPSGYGFAGKFIELVRVFRGEPSGAFAVAPMANYLLASAGFFCLLLWAAAHGMFRDIETPKHEMLAREALLDASQSSSQRDKIGAQR
jgi:hypothetical protein